VEPYAAFAVHHPGQDHEHPGQPLRYIRARGHGHAGASLDDHVTCLADGGKQVIQFTGRYSGNGGSLDAIEPRKRGTQSLDAVHGLDQVDRAVIEDFARQPRKDRIVLTGVRRDVTGRVPRRLCK
jgi:hypothetical protein